jgi:ABC-type nitrate/sulfonate/bicarbonate transport system substrate-binding protein
VLATPDVKSPRDLARRKVGVTGLPSDDAVLRSIVTGAGGDYDAVEKVTIGFNAVPALLGGRVAGATAFWNVEGVALRSERPGMHAFRVDAYGAPPYPELVLVTSRSTLRDDPALVHATVRALVRGYGVTVHDPASSLNDVESRVHGLDARQLQTQLDVLIPALSPPGGRIGGLDPRVLARWARWEARFGIVSQPPDVRRLFDTQVVPDSGAASDDAA